MSSAKDDPSNARPTESLTPPWAAPVNDTWVSRSAVLTAVALLGHSRRHQSGGVLMLSAHLCVKYGPSKSLAEASAMIFVAHHTTVPVPKVHCAFIHRRCTYIVMERIKGHMLGKGWVFRNMESKEKILSQLKSMVEQIRQISAPGPGVSNINGGPLYDPRPSMPGPDLRYGPFATIPEFHKYLRLGMESHADLPPEVNELIGFHEGPWSGPVFTHGDLSSLNIMCEGDDITGIVDWETSGWFPDYWEYTTACQVNPQNLFWSEEIDKFLNPLPRELALDKIRRERFGGGF
ncbi:kinase-like domain-containing protein [Phyllosticta capitalensis]